MSAFFERIAARKTLDVFKIRGQYTLQKGDYSSRFRDAVNGFAVIADVKKEHVTTSFTACLTDCETAGAAAIVITTDSSMGGIESDLTLAAKHTSLPLIRKDYIIDPLQLAETKALGGSAVLLMVALLKEKTGAMVEAAFEIGIEPVVEVHTEDELAIALATKANCISIINTSRDTNLYDPQRAIKLSQKIPPDRCVLVESGWPIPRILHFYFDHGVQGCILGEAFTKSEYKEKFIRFATMPFLKIGGVQSKDVAKMAAEEGVDLIGIQCIQDDERYVSFEATKSIAKGAREGGAEPVCVFKNHTFAEMQEICTASEINVIQLEGEISQKEHIHFTKPMVRLFLLRVQSDGAFSTKTLHGFNDKRDYILYEIPEDFDMALFKPKKDIPFFIRFSGKGAENVKSLLASFPGLRGIDLSKEVENLRGNKELFHIKEFIQIVKG